MMTAQKNRGRRVVAAAALAILSLGVTSCGAINEQATTFQYAASDGIVLNVGDVEVRNLMLVTKSATDEARLLGSLVNSTDAAQKLEVTLASGSVSIDVPAKSVVSLEKTENAKTVPSTGVLPGALAQATLSIGSGSDEVRIPVIDGTLEEYRDYVPGGHDPKSLEHLTPSEKPAAH
ncbi:MULTISPECIES: hypothetical protein [Paeniglutamicibacter]|uniref:DNA modification methylase n=1 Tax=Paeniglutamicibacter sulfureus TaxID=43666 RepID=A0ABU2BH79_9MICC|nr:MULTISPECIES: hypothetical protein [Paeniglutamicibacter]MCV9995949.1 hypothetical protein [Paeniglutamicibacter sp. ZC-3]MDO2933528.1 hypothetical protein [Paeniglutamicibacter sulfureus]MDR7357945.1 hypothetical protein [Paeniglutamicibacter sulfureus]